MSYGPERSNEVIIQTMSAPRQGHREGADQSDVAHYDAAVYSKLDVGLSANTSQRFSAEVRGLPLRGVERLTIRTAPFNDWLASFLEGEKGLHMMRSRMLETMSGPLRKLLTSVPLSMRIWWSNLAPDLDELPWELTVDAGRRDGEHRVAFLRGLPPENPIPPLPLTAPPRLGMIGAVQHWPDWAHEVARRMKDSARIFDGSIREGLAMVRSEGVEFVHAFTDGVVSGALEGSLYDPWVAPDRATLPAGELSQLLASSRVVVLALSPAANPDPELQRIRGHNVLSAYRCFTYLGTSTARLPTVLAPLGPIPDDQMAHFWIEFYERLSSSWDLTESLRHAQSKFQFSVPIALFSRHAGGKLFQARLQPDADARQLLARRVELLNSEHLTRALDQIRSKYGLELPESVNTLFKKESGRQQKLRGDLDAWTKLEGL